MPELRGNPVKAVIMTGLQVDDNGLTVDDFVGDFGCSDMVAGVKSHILYKPGFPRWIGVHGFQGFDGLISVVGFMVQANS